MIVLQELLGILLTDSTCSVVVLDSFDISTIESIRQENTERAGQILSKNNPNDLKSSWSLGLEGTDRRYVPMNGALSSDQLAWLEETLSRTAEQGETAIVLCHVPLHPRAAKHNNLLWNYQVRLSPRNINLIGACLCRSAIWCLYK